MTNEINGTHGTDYFYPADKIKEALEGNWLTVISGLAPQFDEAMKILDKKKGAHAQCPFHQKGIRKKADFDFRFHDDADTTGGAICSCGSWSNGYELLKQFKKWSYDECKEEVAKFLKVAPVPLIKDKEKTHQKPINAIQDLNSDSVQQDEGYEELEESYSNSSEFSDSDMAEYEVMCCLDAPSVSEVTNAEQSPTECEANVSDDSSKGNLTIDEVKKNKPWLNQSAESLEKKRKVREANQDRIIQRTKDTWEECLLLSNPDSAPLRKYLESRKLMIRGLNLDNDLRFHPSLPYHDEDGVKLGEFPAAVAAFRNPEGVIVTLHRTYLTAKGRKAPVDKVKKVMSVPDHLEMAGGAIRFGEPVNGVLGIAEGKETALSGFRASKIPAWPVYSASLIPSFVPPSGVHTVIHWKDKDRSKAGDVADEKLRKNLEAKGIRVITMTPPIPIPEGKKGVDWNDVLMTQGLFGFPRLDSILAEVHRIREGGSYARAM